MWTWLSVKLSLQTFSDYVALAGVVLAIAPTAYVFVVTRRVGKTRLRRYVKAVAGQLRALDAAWADSRGHIPESAPSAPDSPVMWWRAANVLEDLQDLIESASDRAARARTRCEYEGSSHVYLGARAERERLRAVEAQIRQEARRLATYECLWCFGCVRSANVSEWLGVHLPSLDPCEVRSAGGAEPTATREVDRR